VAKCVTYYLNGPLMAIQSGSNVLKISSAQKYILFVGQQAMVMLRFWLNLEGNRATGNALERALRKCDREDVVNKCMFNVELVTDEMEKSTAKAALHLDQVKSQPALINFNNILRTPFALISIRQKIAKSNCKNNFVQKGLAVSKVLLKSIRTVYVTCSYVL